MLLLAQTSFLIFFASITDEIGGYSYSYSYQDKLDGIYQRALNDKNATTFR